MCTRVSSSRRFGEHVAFLDVLESTVRSSTGQSSSTRVNFRGLLNPDEEGSTILQHCLPSNTV